jgi:hypothetical protein
MGTSYIFSYHVGNHAGVLCSAFVL